MRPLRLEMQAFGPYAHRQVIDFADLKGNAVFLIHGPTGAGKTTILDAMCFALFGDTSSGTERDARAMRSQHAKAGERTEVSLTFELRGTRYRVERAPEQQKWAERGQKRLVTSPATGALYKLTDTGDQLLAAKYNDVKDEVERLLGFTSSQFRQVILIPQGKFRDMLIANEADREKVLRYLFGTLRYESLKRFLLEQEKSARQQFSNTAAMREGVLQQIPGAQRAEDVEALIATVQARQQQITTELQSAGAAKTLADAAFQSAAQQNRLLQEKANAEQAWKRVQAEAPTIELQRKQLQSAAKAKGLDAPYQLLHSRRQDAMAAKKEHEKAQQSLQQAQSATVLAETAVARERQRKPEVERIDRELTALETSRKTVEAIDTLSHNLAKAQQSLQTAKGLVDKSQEELTRYEAEKQKAQLQVQKCEDLAKQVPARKQLLDVAAKLLADAIALRGWEEKLASRQKEFTAKEAKLSADRERYKAVRAEVQRLEQAWRDSIAARLATQLAEGKPCPVCGSVHHPQPAAGTDVLVNDEHLKTLRDQQDALLTAGQDLAKQVSGLEAQVKEAQAHVEGLRTNLGENSGRSLDLFEKKHSEAHRALLEAQSADAALPRHQKAYADLESRLQTATASLKQYQEQFGAADRQVCTLVGQQDAMRKDLPANLTSLAALDEAITGLRKQRQEITMAVEAAEAAATQAKQKLAVTTESVRLADGMVQQRDAALCTAAQEFEQQLHQVGFASEQEYAAARLAEVQMAKLQEQLDDFARREAATRAHLEKCQLDAMNIQAPDLAAAQKLCAETDHQVTTLNQQLGETRNQVAQYAKIVDQLRNLASNLQDLERRHGLLARLTEIAGGRNNLGVSLERFVLGFMLDDVTAAASLRLKHMSRGRYLLQRQRDPETKQPTGLNLEVFDSYTGMSRDVSTLSGGESFLASLSMALGLADVVQARSGGVAMETIFIDEGFGSLDSETLDEAIKAITQIVQTGRLVGIISHVPELRERIPAQLQVIPSRHGSQARFVIN